MVCFRFFAFSFSSFANRFASFFSKFLAEETDACGGVVDIPLNLLNKKMVVRDELYDIGMWVNCHLKRLLLVRLSFWFTVHDLILLFSTLVETTDLLI